MLSTEPTPLSYDDLKICLARVKNGQTQIRLFDYMTGRYFRVLSAIDTREGAVDPEQEFYLFMIEEIQVNPNPELESSAAEEDGIPNPEAKDDHVFGAVEEELLRAFADDPD